MKGVNSVCEKKTSDISAAHWLISPIKTSHFTHTDEAGHWAVVTRLFGHVLSCHSSCLASEGPTSRRECVNMLTPTALRQEGLVPYVNTRFSPGYAKCLSRWSFKRTWLLRPSASRFNAISLYPPLKSHFCSPQAALCNLSMQNDSRST